MKEIYLVKLALDCSKVTITPVPVIKETALTYTIEAKHLGLGMPKNLKKSKIGMYDSGIYRESIAHLYTLTGWADTKKSAEDMVDAMKEQAGRVIQERLTAVKKLETNLTTCKTYWG